jgi:hypothetical protein
MKTLIAFLAACAAATAQSGAGRIAILQDELPGLDPSAIQAAARVLERSSIAYTPIHLAELCSREMFNTARFDTLILNHSDHLTASARDNLLDYLKAGGDLVLLGGSGFVHRQSMPLPAFSRYEPYALDGIETVDAADGQDIVAPLEARGHYSGWSAVGFTRRAAKFIPLLAAKDRYGRSRGWAAGLLTHYAEYPASNWLLFGIDTPAFYSSAAFGGALTAALGRMRGDDLWKGAQAEHQKAVATRIRLTTPAPAGFVHTSPDGKHLLTPDGKPLFLTGVNYHRGLDQGEWSQGTFDDTVFEDDFRKAREAGINFIRLGPASRFYDSPEVVRECARKYGIYLIIILNWGTRRDFVANAERVAQMYADEPMVLGYDLENEPAPEALAGLTFDGNPSPALALQKDKPTAEALAAFRALWPKAWERDLRGSASTFPGFPDKPVAAEYAGFRDAVDQTLSLWIARHIEAIRKYDKHHLISVGYNTILAVLPANRQLDFLTHHVYESPYSYESVMINLTTMDRLAKLWPDKPFTLGEFGYTNGLLTNDGRYLDFHTSAVGEMAHYLYALAKGYSGVTKWVLTDWHWDIIGKAGDRGRPTQIYEAYFGMYYYDGHPPGLERAKPIVPAVRFLREYLDAGGQGGDIQIVRAPNAIGAGYVYRAPNALFVGDGQYRSAGLEFTAEHPANVMLSWKGSELRAMSTADAQMTIDPKAFLPGVAPETLRVSGHCGQWKLQDGRIVITALEGESLTIAARR